MHSKRADVFLPARRYA